MFETELAFGPRCYENDVLPERRAQTDEAFPGPEPPRRGTRLFKTSFGAAFALATAAFWFTMVTGPPKTEAAPPQPSIADQIIDPPGLDAYCKNFTSTCPEDGRKWGGEVLQGRT
jgi:hypothetical protein